MYTVPFAEQTKINSCLESPCLFCSQKKVLTSGCEANFIFLRRLLRCDVTQYILVEAYPVSQEPIARTIYPDDGGIMFLRSVEKCVLRHSFLSFKRRYIPLNIGSIS